MSSTLITKNSSTASAVPLAGDLVKGELAVNVTDKKLYTKDNSAAVVKLVGSLGNQEANAVAITGGSITGMSTPSASTDVANKEYVDSILGSATSAAASAAAAAASYDSFDDRYLGSKSTAPTVDNDGNTLLEGALYWNSSTKNFWVWNGSAWAFSPGSTLAGSTDTQKTTLGSNAGASITSGFENTAVGNNALASSTSFAGGNTAVGSGALRYDTSGSNNTAAGAFALTTQTNGSSNSAYGYRSLRYSTTAASNTAQGFQSGMNVTTGSNNTLIGFRAGASGTNDITTGGNNTVIGASAAASSATVDNEITLGNSSVTTLRCQVTTITSLSDARDKANITDLDAGLNLINAIRPVSFDWNMRDGAKVGVQDTGFIAQELKFAQEVTGLSIPGLVYESNPEKLEAGYGKLIPVMVKAIQELSAQVEELKAQLQGE